jgi:hypothetical protein
VSKSDVVPVRGLGKNRGGRVVFAGIDLHSSTGHDEGTAKC